MSISRIRSSSAAIGVLGLVLAGLGSATPAGARQQPAASAAPPVYAAPLASAVRPAPAAAPTSAAAAVVPGLRVSRQVAGLSLPWDVKPLGPGRFLVTERETARLYRWAYGRKLQVRFPSSSVWRSGETGLMALAVDPGFASNRRFYTCQGGFTGNGGHDVRVVAWRLANDARSVTRLRVLLGGLPASSGRHGGCRLLILGGTSMMVGTGDAAVGTNPRNLDSLGGKTLMLDRMTGAPWPGNPFISSPNLRRRYVYTYGHRNVQGLAQRADGSVWTVEHGPSRDDEVNRVVRRGDYGWHPVPGYDESVPMTDQGLPGPQVGARWRSGSPTVAASGAAWVRGPQWGDYNGTLAVAALKASKLMFMKFSPTGVLQWVREPAAVKRFGRLRSVTNAPNGDLLVTTSNGSGDAVLRVSPR